MARLRSPAVGLTSVPDAGGQVAASPGRKGRPRVPRPALTLSDQALDGAGHLITVAGEIDLATALQLAEYLAQFTDGPVTVDLSAVRFLDSSGMNALLA